MINLKKLALGTGLLAATAQGGTSTFLGQGHVSHPAEYVEISINVISECNSKLSEARNSANKTAKTILDLFRTMIDPLNTKEAAFTNGGRTQKSNGHYVGNNRNTLICANTYSKSTTITLLTTDMNKFEQNFATLEDLIYGQLAGSKPTKEEPVTYATLSSPVAHLFSETVDKVQKQALRKAMINAKDKFEILKTAGCGITKYSITSFDEPAPSANIPNPYAGTRGVPPTTNPSSAPVVFADVWITKALAVSFEFEGGHCSDDDFESDELLGSVN